MVEMFMRRKAALSASQLDQPPVHDALRFFWSGLDLRKVVLNDLKYWPARVGDGQLELRKVPSDEKFSLDYSIFDNCLLWVNSNSYSQDVTPAKWMGDGETESHQGYTIELVVRCDWSVCQGGIIVGHTGAGTYTAAFWGDSTNGIWLKLGGTNAVRLATGPIEGTHCYTVTCAYDPDSGKYLYRGYLDGAPVGEYTNSTCFNSAPSFYPKVALGALASHVRPLTEAEIGRNVRYYKSIWRD